MTCNVSVLSWIEGYKIPFCKKPPHSNASTNLQVHNDEDGPMTLAIQELETLGAITKCDPLPNHFVSPIFLTKKSNGKYRFILNLKRLNRYVTAPYFKMEDYRTAQRLLRKNLFMTTVDLKDAYYSIPMHSEIVNTYVLHGKINCMSLHVSLLDYQQHRIVSRSCLSQYFASYDKTTYFVLII